MNTMGNDAIIPNDPSAEGASRSPQATPLSSGTKAPLEADIANILKETKLPERRVGAEAGAPQAHYDTTLADPERAMPQPLQTRPEQTASTDSSGIASLHTLKDDLQHVVQQNKISYVRAVALEEERRQKKETVAQPKRDRRPIMRFVLTGLLVGVGILALLAVFFVQEERSTPQGGLVQQEILFAEQTVQFPIDNQAPGDLKRTIASARASGSLTLGAILQIIPVRNIDTESGEIPTPVTSSEFLAAIGVRAPEELVRALGDPFFFGIHTVDENAPIMIIPVTSYERALAGMREWEKLMNADLEPIFTQLPAQKLENDLVVERVFDDMVIRNYDVRALKDDAGVVQLYYSFPTRNILIIAESQFSFAEILGRLRADRRL